MIYIKCNFYETFAFVCQGIKILKKNFSAQFLDKTSIRVVSLAYLGSSPKYDKKRQSMENLNSKI